jgi:hypothetical protein
MPFQRIKHMHNCIGPPSNIAIPCSAEYVIVWVTIQGIS